MFDFLFCLFQRIENVSKMISVAARMERVNVCQKKRNATDITTAGINMMRIPAALITVCLVIWISFDVPIIRDA